MRIGKKYKVTAFCLVLAVGTAYMFKEEKPRPFNVILITIDALRPDHLGCYGYRLNTSPNIDNFAKESATFTQAITQGTVTFTALPSILTSTYPRTHGVYRGGCRINSSVTTLAQILKKNNYITSAILAFNIREVMPGLEKGFDVCEDLINIKADKITEKAIYCLEQNRHNKFFLWLHYFDPHAPYRPPSPYNRMFMDDYVMGKEHLPISKLPLGGFNSIPAIVAENNITDVNYYKSQYDGEIRFMDEQVGLLLEKIRELNLEDRTVIVITADHGELLGEHGIYFWHGTLYDQSLRVPLLIKCKNIIPASKITQQVKSIDIAPTILAILRLPKGREMQGESLMPAVLKKKYNLSSCVFSESPTIYGDISRECVRAEGWKLIYKKFENKEVYELYNLNADPYETNNLIDAENKKFKVLKKRLDSWVRRTPSNPPQGYHEISGDIKERLRSLGYLQ